MKPIQIIFIFILILNLEVKSQNNYYQFKELPYSYNALEPYIDSLTMETHYDKHHRAYYNNFVKAMQDGGFEIVPIEHVMTNISNYPAVIRNMGGGYWNHEFFWDCMSPVKSEPSKELESALIKQFAGVENFKTEFSKSANSVFGSGWAWLIKDKKGELKIITTPNQDNPLMDSAAIKGKPLLVIDVWEHAYYLKHKNKRADYVNDFWNIVNWDKVSERFSE